MGKAFFEVFPALKLEGSTGEIMEGEFPPKAKALVKEFILKNQNDLLEIPDYEELLDFDTPGSQEETAVTPIELQIFEDEETPALTILYDAGLYRKESMNRFAEILGSVCRLLLTNGCETRSTRDIISEAKEK